MFDAGSLFRPYHSVNTDITSTTGAATAGTWKPATSSGTGVPGDPARAVELYARACEGFAEACFPHIKTRDACLRLGRIDERGEGGPPDVKRALLIYREFCNQWGETPEACQGLDRLSSRGEREPPRR